MAETVSFIFREPVFCILVFLVNISLGYELAKALSGRYRDAVIAASGKANETSFLRRLRPDALKLFNYSERKGLKKRLTEKAKQNMERAGCIRPSAAYIYIIMKYLLPIAIFLLTWAINFPSLLRPVLAALCVIVPFEMNLKSRRRKIKLTFQKNAYKIYKYLHNQISSGIKVTAAVKTAYEVIDDKELKEQLLRLSAGYDLTLDMDKSLEEFEERMNSEDAATLCTAIKLGVDTGDNADLLARQEEIMFKKYFNYIQAETEACKGRSLIAASMFTLIIVIMIAVPLINNAVESMSRIFIY